MRSLHCAILLFVAFTGVLNAASDSKECNRIFNESIWSKISSLDMEKKLDKLPKKERGIALDLVNKLRSKLSIYKLSQEDLSNLESAILLLYQSYPELHQTENFLKRSLFTSRYLESRSKLAQWVMARADEASSTENKTIQEIESYITGFMDILQYMDLLPRGKKKQQFRRASRDLREKDQKNYIFTGVYKKRAPTKSEMALFQQQKEMKSTANGVIELKVIDYEYVFWKGEKYQLYQKEGRLKLDVWGAMVTPLGDIVAWDDSQLLLVRKLADGKHMSLLLRGHKKEIEGSRRGYKIFGVLPLPGNRFISWSSDESIRVWDVSADNSTYEMKALELPEQRVTKLEILDDTRFVTLSASGRLGLGTFVPNSPPHHVELSGKEDWIADFKIDEKGRLLAWEGNEGFWLWQRAPGGELVPKDIQMSEKPVKHAEFTEDGEVLYMARNGEMFLLEIDPNGEILSNIAIPSAVLNLSPKLLLKRKNKILQRIDSRTAWLWTIRRDGSSKKGS